MLRRLLPFFLLCLGCGETDGSISPGTTATGGAAPTWELLSIEPGEIAADTPFVLIGRGGIFLPGDRLAVDKVWYSTELSDTELRCNVEGKPRGNYSVTAHRGSEVSSSFSIAVANAPPRVVDPGPQTLAEDEDWQLQLQTVDFDQDDTRILVTGLPPGARFEAATKTIFFRPDFIQGGKSHTLTVYVSDGLDTTSSQFELSILDSIQPPEPTVVSDTAYATHRRLRLDQVTDSYLDSEGYAGRTFDARIVIPTEEIETKRYPVRVYLHGLGGSPYTGGNGDSFRIYPHDDDNTYWWGYSEKLPASAPAEGRVLNYTQRRVLHLIEYVLSNFSWADPEQVYVIGSSMGGAGATALGLLHARHFAYVHATLGQTIPRNHRPARISQLSTWWGSPELNLLDAEGMGNWDRGDMTRALLNRQEARNQFVFTKHGKDDRTIHFGAVSMPSSLTQLSFLDAVQKERMGHHCVWDEGGHGPSDPVLGSNWWDSDWNKLNDQKTFLRRNLAFAAFSKSTADNDPGTGEGNGNQKWSENSGYAGHLGTPNDTGWNGDVAGVLNRYLRWDAQQIVDEVDRFEIPLWADTTPLQTKVPAGYPPKGNEYAGELPIFANVTPRRVQNFLLAPNETVRWSFGDLEGTVTAQADGSVTVPQLGLDNTATTLILRRTSALLKPPQQP